MNTTRFCTVLVVAAFAALAAGCSSSGSPSNTSYPYKQPGVGSMFIYHSQEIGANDSVMSQGYDTMTVVSAGISYQGRPNVNEYAITGWTNQVRVNGQRQKGTASGQSAPTGTQDNATGVPFSYESDGDLAVWSSYSGWHPIPFFSHSTVSYATTDTFSLTRTYVGSDVFTVKGSTFPIEKVQNQYYTLGVVTSPPTTYSFSKDLGWIVKFDTPFMAFSNGVSPGVTMTLVDYKWIVF